MSLYARVVRPALFALDAERAHELVIGLLSTPAIGRALTAFSRPAHDERLHQHMFGLSFAHPVGLAAGLDKQGTAAAAWGALGFAFAEIGTVTPRPQPGNPRPRLFRLPADRAVINRFGFNSEGADGVVHNLASTVATIPIGINLGKNKDTPNERAAADYTSLVDALHPFADYFVINVSSPNTSGLRDLQHARELRALVDAVVARVKSAHTSHPRDGRPSPIPVLVKVSPDMNDADLLDAATAALESGAAGLVATNTTTGREGLRVNGAIARESGGLSGAPLRGTATHVCRVLFKHFGGAVPIVGVGGIFTAGDAYERIRAGASLVQLYTALVYEGPGVLARLVRGLADLVTRDGFSTISEAIGADVK